jgi:hypothetical protein
MDLKFNIIFVPGTVRYLSLAVRSLLKYSTYHYRLVANGLGEQECSILKSLCQGSDRLEYFYYPSKGVIEHGTMLNLLFQRENTPYFCMADSDIFAIGPFVEELEEQLQECDVLSSCMQLGMGPTDVLPGFTGMCLQTPGGLPLAPTFFSIYRTELFRKIILETKVGFEVYHPAIFLPETIKAFDLPDNLEKIRRIDTGKLLNMVAGQYGARFVHYEFPNLIHIGGISRKEGSLRRKMKEAIRRCLRLRFLLNDEFLQKEVRRRSRGSRYSIKLELPEASLEEARIRARALRNPLAMYFTHFLRSLFDGTPKPRFELSDEPLTKTIEKTTKMICDLYNEEYGS